MTSGKQGKFWLKLLVKIFRVIFKNAGRNASRISNNQHVVPHPDGWAIRGEGNERYTAVYDLQEDAIERAKDIANNYRADVIIHRKDGTIRDRVSFR